MRIAISAIAALTLLGAGLFAYRAATAFRAQYRDFYPARGTVGVPSGAIGRELRAVSFELDDGTRIAGWALPPRNGTVILFIHGSPGDRSGLLSLAETLHRSGYGALLLDMPGHGESGGEANWGPGTRLAVQRGIGLALQQPSARQVAIFGYSMGSCIAALVAAQDQRVGALVLLAPYTALADQLRYQYRRRLPFVGEFAVLAARMAGVPVDEMRTVDALRAAPARPLLIIAGDRDNAIPVAMPRELFAAARGPKTLWIVQGAGHLDAREVAGPAAFDERVRAFLDQAFFGDARKDRIESLHHSRT
jgi:pimeloyl-ACP methyl ester carboxylesterase